MHTPSAAAFENLTKKMFFFLLLLFLQRIDFALSGGGVLRSSNRASCLVLRENTHYTHTILLLMGGGDDTAMLSHFPRALDVCNRKEIRKSEPGVTGFLKTKDPVVKYGVKRHAL